MVLKNLKRLSSHGTICHMQRILLFFAFALVACDATPKASSILKPYAGAWEYTRLVGSPTVVGEQTDRIELSEPNAQGVVKFRRITKFCERNTINSNCPLVVTITEPEARLEYKSSSALGEELEIQHPNGQLSHSGQTAVENGKIRVTIGSISFLWSQPIQQGVYTEQARLKQINPTNITFYADTNPLGEYSGVQYNKR